MSIRSRRDRGFTLVEMMVVIVIIGILAAVVTTQVISHADKARVTATKAAIVDLDAKVQIFKLNHHRLPENLDDLRIMPSYIDPTSWPQGGYYKKELRDGWDNKFEYRKPGTNGQPYDIISFGEDGRPGGEGNMEDLWNHEAYKR